MCLYQQDHDDSQSQRVGREHGSHQKFPVKKSLPHPPLSYLWSGPWPWRNFQQQRASTVKRVVEISSNVSQQKSRLCDCSCKTICVQRLIFSEDISFAPKSSPAIKTTATATLETSHFCGQGVNKISLYSVPLSSPIFSVYKREPL